MAKKRIFAENEIKMIINMYQEGETYSEIAKALHTKGSKISEILKSMGYGVRKRNELKNHDYLSMSRKNKVNEEFFEEINTESKAYWLGFLYADGYICKKTDKYGNQKGGSVELTLKSDDKYHIQNFLDDIKSTAPISDKKTRLNNNEYCANRTCVTSIKIVNDLIKQGCFENKSLILLPPENVPEELMSHFIRGYFDGDGCVCFYPERYGYRYSILGTKEILEFIAEKSGLKSYDIRAFEHKKCYELVTYAKKDVEIFHNYIYKNKSIYLERKYQKSLAMIKWCELEDSRTDTQKMADLLDFNLFINDDIISDFDMYYINVCTSETAAMADLLD